MKTIIVTPRLNIFAWPDVECWGCALRLVIWPRKPSELPNMMAWTRSNARSGRAMPPQFAGCIEQVFNFIEVNPPLARVASRPH